MSNIDQKKYLKKYLGIGKGPKDKKKKKKVKNPPPSRLTIVDDDIDVLLDKEIQQDLEAENEEAPQIVSIIDERPPSLRIDEKSKSSLWMPIGAPDNIPTTQSGMKFESLKLGKVSKTKSLLDKIKKEPEAVDDNGGDCSPPRRKRRDSDNSPPRRSNSENSSNNLDRSPIRKSRKTCDSDNSPPRKQVKSDILSPRSIKKEKHSDDDDLSPVRIKRERSEDNSPPRRVKKQSDNDKDRNRKKSRWTNAEEDDKLKKTLDGKTAGLQNAKDLVLETRLLKQKEDELFRNMSAEVSGANAATVLRTKEKVIDLEEEERKKKQAEANKEKYNKWGRGLKQVDDANERMQNELYEMSKPLARYADDEDLEQYLKSQDREGDPMLAYIRSKRKKKAVTEGKPVIQQYEGDAPPNRFGIRPGYRWDGVNRSNGYEQKWFEVQNSRQANVEETYKWSTEDM